MSFRAISCLACQTVLMPRSRLVDFNKFYYNLKVTRGGHEFRHESTGTRAQGTKAQVLDMLYIDDLNSINNQRFKEFLEDIYPEELVVSETSESKNVVSHLDLLIDISKGDLVCSIFDKKDSFDFDVVNLTYLRIFRQPQLMVHTSHS